MSELFEDWGEDFQRGSGSGITFTNCPQDMNKDDNTKVNKCSGHILYNFLISDSNGKTHTLSKKVTFHDEGAK